MSRRTRKHIDNLFDRIATHWDSLEKFEFKKIELHDSNLYLIFEKRISTFNGKLNSYLLDPIGLILEVDNDYIYLSYEENDEVNDIVKSFCEEFLIIEA